MNFFKLYMGDYQRDTGALSLAEHGAYLMMLQLYYATEKPLPIGADLYKILRVSGKKERAAVDKVAALFWIEKDGKLVNTRAVAEIEKSVRQRLVNQEVGKLGGRPRKLFSDPKEEPNGLRDQDHVGSKTETESVSESEPNRNPNHSHSHKEHSVGRTVARTEDLASPTTAGRACLAMRQAGCAHANPSHPELLAAVAEGVTPETLADTVREAMARSPPITHPFSWAIATARSRHATAAVPHPQDRPHALSPPRRKLSAVEQVEEAIRERREREAGRPPIAGLLAPATS